MGWGLLRPGSPLTRAADRHIISTDESWKWSNGQIGAGKFTQGGSLGRTGQRMGAAELEAIRMEIGPQRAGRWHVKFVPRCYAYRDGVATGRKDRFWRCRPLAPTEPDGRSPSEQSVACP